MTTITIDTETTGTNPASDRIVAIAWQVVTDGVPGPVESSLVRPLVPIPASATKVHGIDDDRANTAPPWTAVYPRFVAARGAIDTVVGHNVTFDLKVIAAECARYQLAWRPFPYVLDTLRIWQVLEPRTLTDAMRRFAPTVPFTDAHEAGADVTAATAVWLAQAKDVRLPIDVAALHALLWPKAVGALDPDGKIVYRDGAARWAFGKHSGTPLDRTPRPYLEWVLGADFSTEVKTLIMAVLEGRVIPPPEE